MLILRTESLIGPAVLLLFSSAAAVFDYRKRAVPAGLFLAAFAAGVIVSIGTQRDALSVLRAFLPGLLLFGMNRCTGRIGSGDAVFVLCLALFLSLREVLFLVFLAFFLAALVSLAILASAGIRGRAVGNRGLPFLCFFLPGVVLWIINIYGQA